MKKLIFIILFGAISSITFGNGKPGMNKNQPGKSSASYSASGPEVEKLTKELFMKKIWNFSSSPNDWKYLGTKPAIIDFYADWCGPCKIAGPILEEVGSNYCEKIVVYKVNTDQERELAQIFRITGIPAFLYIPLNGKPIMTSGISNSKEETKKMFIDNIEKYLLIK